MPMRTAPQHKLEQPAKQLSLRRVIGRGCIILGTTVIIGAGAAGLSAPANTLKTFLLVAGWGALLLVTGILLFKWKRH